jgi:hypothetical protein
LREIERDRSADRGLFVDELLLMAFKALSVLARRHKGVDNTSSTQEGDNGAKHSLGVRVGSEGAMTEGSPVSGDVVEHGSCDSRSGLVQARDGSNRASLFFNGEEEMSVTARHTRDRKLFQIEGDDSADR